MTPKELSQAIRATEYLIGWFDGTYDNVDMAQLKAHKVLTLLKRAQRRQQQDIELS